MYKRDRFNYYIGQWTDQITNDLITGLTNFPGVTKFASKND